MDFRDIQTDLKKLARKNDGTVYVSELKKLIKKLIPDMELAKKLWDTGDQAAREVAVRIAPPEKATEKLLEAWVADLDEWGLTDAFTGNLVRYTKYAEDKAHEWAQREPQFEKRAAFSLVAQMAWEKNDFDDDVFIGFLPRIEEAANDDRLYVKKAVNWALRDIGKRNRNLRRYAADLARDLQQSANKTAQWVGRHRAHEFMKQAV